MKINLVFCLTFFVGLLFSCSKDDSQKSKTDLLTESTWTFDYFMNDTNNNLKPDDEKGSSQDLKIKFNSDRTLEYTLNGVSQNATWTFEYEETVIKFIGIEFENVISNSNEFVSSIYQLDESNLILQGTTVSNPEQLTFQIFIK